MRRWDKGRDKVDQMIGRGEIDRVSASREQADLLLRQARAHIETARSSAAQDPAGAYSLVYDAARKALAAVLANQGLRASSRGGHIAVYEAATAQLVPPLGEQIRPFDRMRRTRIAHEYPVLEEPELEEQDVLNDIPRAEEIIEVAEQVIDNMPVY